MARMFPEEPLAGTKSSAERMVFYALKELLPNEYMVLHSVPVYRKDAPAGRLKDGEADFVIIHPDKGLLVVEVKGGEILREQNTGDWYSIGFNGKFLIKDPYVQAKSNVHDIVKDLGRERTTRRFRFSFGHLVWFPNVNIAIADLKLSPYVKGITLGKDDLENTANSIPRVFKNALGETPKPIGPGEIGARAIVDFLSPSLKLHFSLSSIRKEQERQIHQATVSQYRVLTYLKRHNRALICGPAGSGKTFLAMEKVKRILDNDPNAKVLFTCFNCNLVKMLRQALSSFEDQVDIFHFHGLCFELLKRAHLPFPQKDPHSSEENFFDAVLPRAMQDAIDVLDGCYDAIIVDEAQDFKADWWLTLECLMNDPQKGVFYIFYDDNQAIYRDCTKNFPINDAPITLGENCRNTQQIFSYLNNYYSGEPPEPIGPEGPSPIIIKLSQDQNEEELVGQILEDLVAKQGFFPQDIVLLTPRSKDKSKWGKTNCLGKYCLKWLDSPEDPKANHVVNCSSIHSFKGLESPVIVVTEIEVLGEKYKNSLLYVACSRARSLLYVIQDD